MTFKYTLWTAAVLATATLGIAQAQNTGTAKSGDKTSGEMVKPSSTGNTRADVKAETAAAKASGPLSQGEQSTPSQGKKATKAGPSSTTRSDVKAETSDAKASGPLSQGEQSTPSQGKKAMKAVPSGTTRAEVEAEAAAANRAGITPKGQESVKDQNRGVSKP